MNPTMHQPLKKKPLNGKKLLMSPFVAYRGLNLRRRGLRSSTNEKVGRIKEAPRAIHQMSTEEVAKYGKRLSLKEGLELFKQYSHDLAARTNGEPGQKELLQRPLKKMRKRYAKQLEQLNLTP